MARPTTAVDSAWRIPGKETPMSSMNDSSLGREIASSLQRLGLVTTYPPTWCGISKFSHSLVNSLASTDKRIEIEIVRLIDGRSAASSETESVLEIVPDLPIGIRAAARRLNSCDVVVLQHEFGIYGANDGESIVELIGRVHRPMIAILHTVLADPSERQRRIIEEIAANCRIVALSQSARRILISHYAIDPSIVTTIRHGAAWSPRPPNRPPRRQLITWGLLGPGKGLERAIDAVAALRDLEPTPRYRIVGRTHPAVARQSGLSYRRSLEEQVNALGAEDIVEFIDTYVAEEELEELVAASDLVLVPYDNDNQISSGVLTEAVAAARPVVATRFPHAEELLGSGAGITVGHDSQEMAEAVRELLTDPVRYASCASTATVMSLSLSWGTCGFEYSRLVSRLLFEFECGSIDE